MIDTTQVGAATPGGGIAEAMGGKGLGKEAFLKLLVAQLKHQDPLKPQDNTAFVAELAQFSNLEQVMGINDRLDLLSLQNRGLQNTEVAGLVGTTATVRGGRVTLDGTGTGASAAFTLDGKATSVTVRVLDASGKELRAFELGPRSAGTVTVPWDGKDGSGNLQPAGSYQISVEAKGTGDALVGVTQSTTSKVTAVSFGSGYPELELANGLKVPVADLLRVEANTTQP